MSKYCPACFHSCATCTGPTMAMCLACKPTYTYSEPKNVVQGSSVMGTCSCDPGTYDDAKLMKCLSCDASCYTCKSSGNTGCLECSKGYNMVKGVCLWPDNTPPPSAINCPSECRAC